VRLYHGALTAAEIMTIASTPTVNSRLNATEEVVDKKITNTVYPNPVHNSINLDLPKNLKGNASVSVIDMSGRKYLTKTVNLERSLMTINLAGTKMNEGVYFVVIRSAEFNGEFKFYKKD
jgi:hypothetical protein